LEAIEGELVVRRVRNEPRGLTNISLTGVQMIYLEIKGDDKRLVL
jgi:hypothetical protein